MDDIIYGIGVLIFALIALYIDNAGKTRGCRKRRKDKHVPGTR